MLGSFLAVVDATVRSTPASAETALSTRFLEEIIGDVLMTGNATLTCPSNDSVCLQALNDGSANGNARNMQYIDVDSDGSTFQSSSAGVTLPAGATVEWAGLYWAGTTQGANAVPNPALLDTVLLDTPAAGGYVTIDGEVLSTSTLNDDSYAGFAEITDLVTAAGDGTYTVANVQTTSGPGSTGAWGSWAIVVVYNDPTALYRHIQIWDGYESAFFENLDFAVSGITTPATGPVAANVGVYAGDGEPDVGGDNLLLDGTALVANPLNPLDSFFNSTISRFGQNITDRDPATNYSLVSDIDTVNADGVISPGTSSFDVTIETSEGIWPVLLWVSVEIDADPEIQVVKSGPTVVFAPELGTFTFEVSHTAGSDGTPAIINTVTDDVAGPATYVSGDDGNGVLDDGEVWVYEAQYTFVAGDAPAVTNTVTVDYSEGDGDPGSVDDDHTTQVLLPSTLSGTVYNDADSDGTIDTGEGGIGGVPITLTGTDDLGNPVSISIVTEPDGTYTFTGLRPGTYSVAETTQPSGYLDGIDTAGSAGGSTATNDVISNIVIASGTTATGYNFGELFPLPDWTLDKSTSSAPTQAGQTLTYSFELANTGNVAIDNVNLSDPKCSSGPSLLSGDVNNNNVLDVGETWTFSCVSIAVTQAEVDAGQVDNEATATGTPEGGTLPEVTDDVSVPIAPDPVITLVKSSDVATVSDAGDPVQYSFDVTNDGNVTLDPISVSDPLVGAVSVSG